MSFQNPSQRQNDPTLSHLTLVKSGPKLASIKTAPKTIKGKKDPNKTFHLITLELDDVNHTYFIPNRKIEDALKAHVGKKVVLIASGNEKQGTATMEVQPAGVPASSLPNAPKPETKEERKASKPVPANHGEINTKKFLCQAANLMRLCVKKANDIAVELDLPNEHRQGIATTLFIQADRNGFIKEMPLNPYNPEELGWGASKAESLKKAEPDNE
jgi:hypothetical protein